MHKPLLFLPLITLTLTSCGLTTVESVPVEPVVSVSVEEKKEPIIKTETIKYLIDTSKIKSYETDIPVYIEKEEVIEPIETPTETPAEPTVETPSAPSSSPYGDVDFGEYDPGDGTGVDVIEPRNGQGSDYSSDMSGVTICG